MLPQDHIDDHTPMGGHLLPGGGATFRVWAPAAREVHLLGTFNAWDRDESSLLLRRQDGRWTGFVPAARLGDEYMFHVVGEGSEGRKRDPYARELEPSPAWPDVRCVLTDPAQYPWHDGDHRPPSFADLILYQLHVGCYFGPDRQHRSARFLDLIDRIDHLAALGVNAIQLMPVVEFQTMFSMGYNGTDYFSPELDYEVSDPAELDRYLQKVNDRLARKGHSPLTPDQARGSTNQLKILVDLCHLEGLSVILDVVYNHAGGDFHDESLYFFDRQPGGDDNRSLYFTEQGWAGGLVFAFWKTEVRQFLIDNAVYWLRDLHVDGLRYDEVSVIDRMSGDGWRFCQDLTSTVRSAAPGALQNAEYWPLNPAVVSPREGGGAGFDTTQHDGLRDSVRAVVTQAAGGMERPVDLGAVAVALALPGFDPFWRAVQCLENHDLVYRGREPRIPALADPADPRSRWARGRARAATGLLLAAPGIPMLFMGQELLEDKPWDDSRSPDHLVDWDRLANGDRDITAFLRFVREATVLRRRHPALRRGAIHVFHVHDGNRILAFQRWIEGEGRDVVVVISFNDDTFPEYRLGFPGGGEWLESFNSGAYDPAGPEVAGNLGRISAGGEPLHGLPTSASIVIPANSMLVFTRDAGDR